MLGMFPTSRTWYEATSRTGYLLEQVSANWPKLHWAFA